MTITEAEAKKREEEAESDAEWLLLLLLLIPKRRSEHTVEFNAAAGRFYVNGKSVPISQVRKYLARIEQRQADEMGKLFDDLEAGRITIAEWQRKHESKVKSSHVLAAALAIGSISAAVVNPTVISRIAIELDLVRKFREDIEKSVAGSPKRIKARARSYAKAVAITYGQIEQEVRSIVGVQTECRRIRRASESCKGCIEVSYRWMPIADMPPIGTLQCGYHCRCYLEYR